MKLLIVHISDLHLKAEENQHIKRAPQIASAIVATDPCATALVIVVSGDFVFSGKREQFDLAEAFLDSISSSVRATSRIKEIEYVIAPGNHDCDFDKSDQTRELLNKGVADLGGAQVDEALIGNLTKVQDEYYKFLTRIGRRSLTGSERLHHVLSAPNGFPIDFHVLNTSWTSRKTEIQGKLVPPVLSADRRSQSGRLAIAVFHHPLNWFEATHARNFRSSLEGLADVVLTGHEHTASLGLRHDYWTDSRTVCLEANVFSHNGSHDKGGFSVLVIDDEISELEVAHYLFERGGQYVKDEDRSRLVSLTALKADVGSLSRPTTEFSETLEDLESSLIHPHVNSLTLEHVYVSPEVQAVSKHDKDATIVSASTTLDKVLDRADSIEKIVIVGPDQSGKSTSLKRIFKRTLMTEFRCIYLDCFRLSAGSEKKNRKFVEDAITQQWGKDSVQRFYELPTDKRCILLDDLHRFEGSVEAREALLSWVETFADNVVVTIHESWKIERLTTSRKHGSRLDSYQSYELLEMGHVAREALINRWVTAGREFSIGESQAQREINDRKKLLDSVIKKNLMPVYPGVVLLMLQQVEQHTNFTRANGSFGYLYESLLTRLIFESAPHVNIDTAYSFLSYVAFECRQSGDLYVQREVLSGLLTQFCKKYKIALSESEFLEPLIKATVLREHNGEITFKYKYFYYYFVAYYMREKLGEREFNRELEALLDTVFLEESAHIYMFIGYLSKSASVIDALINKSQTLYNGVKEFSFEADEKILSELSLPSPEIEIDATDGMAARKQYNESLDQHERSRQQDLDKKNDNDFVREFNAALRLVQILGQVLRGFPGNVSGEDKMRLLEEAFGLGMRALANILDVVKSDPDGLVAEIVRRRSAEWEGFGEKEKTEFAKSEIAFLCEAVGAGILSKMAEAVGSEQLSPVYKELIEKKGDLASELLDVGIRLECMQAFPKADVARIEKKLPEWAYGRRVLRPLLIKRFYLHKTDHQVKESVSKKFNIAIKGMKQLEFHHRDRKK